MCLCLLWGGNQIFVRLGGEVFGWELKFHEIPVGGEPTPNATMIKIVEAGVNQKKSSIFFLQLANFKIFGKKLHKSRIAKKKLFF